MWKDLNDIISNLRLRTLNSQTFINNLNDLNLNENCLNLIEDLFIVGVSSVYTNYTILNNDLI